MTNEELAEAVASLNELHATANITSMYLIIRQLWDEREKQRAAMVKAKEALIWIDDFGACSESAVRAEETLAALESVGV